MARTKTQVNPSLADGNHMDHKGHEIMAEMPIWRAIIKMAIPSVIMMLIVGGYMFADNVLAIQLAADSYGGSKDVVRMGMSAFGPINALISAFSIMFGMGISTRVSINMGAKRMKRAQNTLKTGTMFAMATSIVLIPILLFAAKPWMESQYDSSAAGQMADMGFDYGWIIIMMLPFSFFNQILSGMFRTEGRNKAMMIPMVASIFVNLFFDWVFMDPAGMGIEGGAWATFISSLMVTIIYLILIIRKKESVIRLKNMFGFKFKALSIIGIALVGISPFLRNFAQSLTQTVEFNVIKDVSSHVYNTKGQVGDWIRNYNDIDISYMRNALADSNVLSEIHATQPDSSKIVAALGAYFDKNIPSGITDVAAGRENFLFFSSNLMTAIGFNPSLMKEMMDPSSILDWTALTTKVAEFASANQMTMILTGVFPIFALFFPTMFGVAQAARPIASFNFGAKRMDRVRQTFWYTFLFATIIGIVMYFLATFALNYPLMHVLGVSFDTPHGTVSTAHRATNVLRIMMISMPMFGGAISSMVLTGSTDRVIQSIFISAMRGVIFFFPTIYTFEAIANANASSEYLFWWFYPVVAAISVITSLAISFNVLRHLDKKVSTLDDRLTHIYSKIENRTWLKRKAK